MHIFADSGQLRIKKLRSSEAYSAFHKRDDSVHSDSVESEKHEYSDKDVYDSDDYDSSYPPSPASPRRSSSRETSGSYGSNQPMLPRRSLPYRFRRAAYRIPQKFMRYFCFAVASTIILFILGLVRLSHISAERVEHYKENRPKQPALWESFDFITRYYGGIRTLVSLSKNEPEYPVWEIDGSTNRTWDPESVVIQDPPSSKSFNAYPDYSSDEYLDQYFPVQECFLDSSSTVRIPPLQFYDGRPSGFPDHVMGSYELLGLPEDICFDRFGRFGPYGHGYSLRRGGLGSGRTGNSEGSEAVWSGIPQVDYSEVDWADAQRRCFAANHARFNDPHTRLETRLEDLSEPSDNVSTDELASDAETKTTAKKHISRTAFVVRAWDEYMYREEDVLYLRSLIAELSLGSGAEYDVHLLVQVKDETIPVFADEETYLKHLEERVPREFHGITTLWSETQMTMIYKGLEENFPRGPELPVYGVYRGLTMAMQYFAHNHPEYEFFWQWEMDIRYSGHFYHLLSKFDSWARDQPRKGLWERNGRFYVPSVHGSWEDFKQMVRVQTESGTDSPNNIWSGITSGVVRGPKGDKPIWGPERPQNEDDWFEIEDDPEPPVPFAKDKYEWGVGEDADLITLNPIFDPDGTTWVLAKDVTGYNHTGGLPPRRAAIITASRLSRRLLKTMHRETAFAKHHAFPEMWPATTALHHGYKAVYVPHPMFVDRHWPLELLAGTMNGGRNGATGGARTSVFGEREHNFLGSTWYYNAGFAGDLWKRWWGLKVNNEGGEIFENDGNIFADEKDGIPGMKGGEGRMCLPPMLVHPVKNVELPVEEVVLGHEWEESDPSA